MNTMLDDLRPSIWAANNNFGNLNLTLWRTPLDFSFGLFVKFGLGKNISDFFIVFLPIILTATVPAYLFVKDLFNSKLAAFYGAMVYGTSTYFLAINSQGHILLTLAANLAILAFWFYIKASTKSPRYYPIALIFLFLSGSSDFRIEYITLGLFAFYTIYKWLLMPTDVIKQRFSKITLTGFYAASIGMNLFWMLPLALSGGATNNSALSRNLFGNNFWDIESAITLHHPFWTGGEPTWFVAHAPAIYFWAIPILALLGLLYTKQRRTVLFFSLVALSGVFLSKQVDQPFGSIYTLLYGKLPGFDAFREATKFYFLTSLGYAVMIAAFVKAVEDGSLKLPSIRHIKLNRLVLTLVAILFLSNVLPYVTGSIRTMFVPRKVPQDYAIFNKYINGQKDFFRTYWVPSTSRWATYDNTHPQVSSINVSQGAWINFVSSSSASPRDQSVNDLTASFSNQLLDAGTVKYVVVPLRDSQDDDDFFKAYGDNRQFFIDTLNQLPYLKRIDIGTSDLAIYENTDIKPFVSTASRLLQVDTDQNLDSAYALQTSINKQPLAFTSKQNQLKDVSSDSITDIFANITRQSLQDGQIKGELPNVTGKKQYIYSRKDPGELSYSVANNNITFTSSNKGNLSVNNQSISQAAELNPQTIPLLTGNTYFLVQGKNVYPLDTKADSQRKLLKENGTVSIYRQSSANLINNSSLEQGLWQKKVNDCNPYDKKANLNMSDAGDEHSKGSHSLKLQGFNHTACTGPDPIQIKAGETYALRFDYKIKNGKTAGYQLQFDDPAKTTIKDELINASQDWSTFNGSFLAPKDAKHVRVIVEGIPDTQGNALPADYYDDFSLVHIALDSTVNTGAGGSTSGIAVTADKDHPISYQDQSFRYSNLIRNGSLENGLWQSAVNDCNNFDTKPVLGMSVSTISKTDGKQSLELNATRHTACTSPQPIPVNENSNYLLSFDYQSPNGNRAGYYVSFNDPNNTQISGQLPINDTNWKSFNKQIIAPYGATSMKLTIYGYTAHENIEKTITRYDNFSLAAIPNLQDTFFLYGKQEPALETPGAVHYTTVDSAKTIITVTNAPTAFYLNMAEAYNTKWKLYLANEKENTLTAKLNPLANLHLVDAKSHFKLDDTLNGWYIDPAQLCKNMPEGCKKNADGSYDLQLVAEFTPQRWFYVGSAISGITLVAAVGYLGFSFYRKRRATKPAKADKAAYRAKH